MGTFAVGKGRLRGLSHFVVGLRVSLSKRVLINNNAEPLAAYHAEEKKQSQQHSAVMGNMTVRHDRVKSGR